jgi:hypothetical protein
MDLPALGPVKIFQAAPEEQQPMAHLSVHRSNDADIKNRGSREVN